MAWPKNRKKKIDYSKPLIAWRNLNNRHNVEYIGAVGDKGQHIVKCGPRTFTVDEYGFGQMYGKNDGKSYVRSLVQNLPEPEAPKASTAPRRQLPQSVYSVDDVYALLLKIASELGVNVTDAQQNEARA